MLVVISENRYENLFPKECKGVGIAKVISFVEKKEYVNEYIIKIKKFNNSYKSVKLIAYADKKLKLEYGDVIYFEGEFEKAQNQRNNKGFNYERYLRQNKIFGILKIDKINIISRDKGISYYFYKLKFDLRNRLYEKFNLEEAGFLSGILIGDKSGITDELRDNFKNSSISHVLAISGLHIIYIITVIGFIINKIINSKKIKNIILIIFLILFIIFTGASPSCIRASVMVIINLIAKNIYRKSDFLTNLALSLDLLLILNYYNIENIGMWLSFLGTLALVKIKLKTSIAVQILIFPIILYSYNTISFTFFISNFFISFLIGPILVIGYINLFTGKLIFIEKFLLKILFKIAEIVGDLKLSKIYVISPNIIFLGIYYILIFIRIFKIEIKKIIKNVLILFLIFSLLLNFFKFNNCFKINFLDVGQGDSCLVTTEKGKTLLIDGGEEENTVITYLLKNRIGKLDYIMVSHFDTDHCGGLFEILQNIKVKNVIIGKQFEDSENYQKFLKIVKENKIKIHVVEAGKRIKIEKNLYFDILWPSSNNIIMENSINNNSLVCKMVYKNFSCIFTGDIEKIAEKAILEKYKDLKSTILKVAHHGSKSSSIEEFLHSVKPKISIIGVGKRNTFGHPDIGVLKRLERSWK